MSADFRTARDADPASDGPTTVADRAARALTPPLSEDSRLAVDIRALLEQGDLETARARFDTLVTMHQRRASRIAYHYLRDAADADEVVQDAFVKVFTRLASYREAWPFEVWFTRILINGCLDRRKARARRDRWFSSGDVSVGDEARASRSAHADGNPEERLLGRERRLRLASAIDHLDGRQRTVFMLCHFGDCTPREVSAMIGLNESTVRVHLFRAARKLRGLLGGRP